MSLFAPEALGWGVSSEGTGVTNVEPVVFVWPVAFCVGVVAVPDPETVMYCAHLDLATTSAAHKAELVARLLELGATPADVGQGDVPWTVLADPEGHVFCVLEPRPIYRDTGPIATVVVDCADLRAMARFWGEATDWTLHEVNDDHAGKRQKWPGCGLWAPRTPTAAKAMVHGCASPTRRATSSAFSPRDAAGSLTVRVEALSAW